MVEGGEGMSIGEVARRSGVAATALRFYETVGVLEPPRRVGGRRVYRREVLDELAMLDVAQRAGFSLAEIGQLLGGIRAGSAPSAQWRDLAERKVPEVDALIAQAQAMRRLLEHGLTCSCRSLRDCAAVPANG